jgi:hypothetical protein
MAEDQEKIERIKSNLRAYLNTQPTGANAEQAKRILVNMQANAPSLPAQHERPVTDEQLGIANQPVRGSEIDTALTGDPATTTARAQPAMDAAAVAPIPTARDARRDQGEMSDPGAREMLAQAETMPALHVAGLGLSALGSKLLAPAAERLGSQAVNVDRDAIVKGGSLAGQKVGDALDHLEKMRTVAPERGPFLDREKENILEQATSAAPVASDALHLGHLAALAGHGPTGLAIRALAAAPGAAMDMAGRGLARTGGAVAGMPASMLSSPLLQAVTGRE